MNRISKLLAFSALFFSLASQSAMASDAELILRHIPVPYGDLDLKGEQGVQSMLQRLQHATVKACGGWPSYNPAMPQVKASFKTCRAEALQEAVATLDQPAVTAAYRERVRSNDLLRMAKQ